MADTVNYYLERMLPELEDLEKRGLFTRSEIKEIVRRRREFEYQLKRQSRIKEDYLRYVEYEKQIDALRCLRKKVILKAMKATGEKWHGSLCDRSSRSRITSIYQRAVTKFKGDLSLWLQYLEYCRSNSTRRMQRVMAKALQLHPHVPGLWMYAAAWEFEHNLNVSAARALMQRGLRMCPHSEDLWLEYFRMELTYAQKLKARKVVLGVESVPRLSADGMDDNKEKTLQRTTESDPESELSIKLARVTFQNAISAIPSSPSFRHRFIEVLDQFDLVQSTIEDEICTSMMNDFPTNEHCWDWKARRRLKNFDGNSRWDQAVKVYEEALRAVPSAQMFELYAKFLEGVLDSHGDILMHDRKRISSSLLQLYELGEKTCLSVNLVEGHILLLSRQGSLGEARDVALKFCNGSLRTCCRIWVLRLSLEIQTAGLQEDQISKLFQQALKLVDISEGKDLWHMALEYFSGKESYFDGLFQLLEMSLGGKAGGQAAADVACCAVDWFLHCQGVKKARQVYNRFLALPGPSLQLFQHCIVLEARTAALGDLEALECMRRVFNAAIEIYGKQNADLWLEYCAQERKVGNGDAATAVYCRARKTLVDPSLFVQKHQLLFS